MIAKHIIFNGLLYGILVNLYLFGMMVLCSPRIWGYNDYSQRIKEMVVPQTKREKKIAWKLSLPWILFAFGFPILSTLNLKSRLNGEISFIIAFLNIFIMLMMANLIDLIILDWLIISKITPDFVIIPGSNKEDYKDMSHHFKGHLKASGVLTLISLILAALITLL